MMLLLVTYIATFASHVSAQALGSLPPALSGTQTAQVVPTTAPSPSDVDGAPQAAFAFADDPDGFEKPEPEPVGDLPRQCDCVEPSTSPTSGKILVGDIRGISDEWCDGGDRTNSKLGLSNMVWAWGQFIDHDVVGSEPLPGAEEQFVKIHDNRFMKLARVGPPIGSADDGTCGGPGSTHTGQVDATPVYGTDEKTEEDLKDPFRNGCYLRAEPGPIREFLPITTVPDDEGSWFIVAGDFRVEEQAILTAMHTVWMREHNRLCAELEINRKTKNLPGEEQFKIAKATVIAKMQTITLEEFLPSLGITDKDLKNRADEGFSISGIFATVEFSIAYRLGHTLIPDTIGDFSIGELFRSQMFFLEPSTNHPSLLKWRDDSDVDIDKMMKTLAEVPAAELDGKMSNALRNILFGPFDPEKMAGAEDLCSRNLYRGRDLHLPTYKGLAECYGVTPDQQTEMETPDAWLGLLREPKGNEPLGPTLKAIMVEHFARMFFGPEGNFWRNTDLKQHVQDGLFGREIRRTTLGEVISMNTGAQLSGNTFKV